MKRRSFGKIGKWAMVLSCALALAACADLDPFQKVEYGQKSLDRRLKEGTMSQYEYDKAIKNYKPQTTLPSAPLSSGNMTTPSEPSPPPTINSPPPGWQ